MKRLLLAALAFGGLVFGSKADPQPNLGRGLRELSAWHDAQPAGDAAPVRKANLESQYGAIARSVISDEKGNRAIVDVKLDGSQSLASVRAHLESMGASISAVREVAGGRGSVLSARLPLERVNEAAKAPGVFSIALVHRPIRRAGSVTSQGVGVIHSDTVNAAGFDGTGITVGVLSDSYDRVSPHALADVQTDDLPGVGNPDGHTQPVYVLVEGGPNNTDEGRAMLQIVHDVAPGARLAFAAVGDTQETFADRIRSLRTDPTAHCDVMVDDISFPDEPFFSDGPIAQAVDDVVHSTTLAGHKSLFYSAAGNDAGAAWQDDFRYVSDSDARGGVDPKSNLKLSQVPDNLTNGGFHNFSTHPRKIRIAQTVTLSGGDATVSFQWDDPSVPGEITTDYNVLVFDMKGNYLTNIDGGTDNNFSTGDPLEIFDLSLAADGTDTSYQLAITRTDAGTHQATHLRYIGSTESSFSAQFAVYGTPAIYGHSAANGVDGVAAYDYVALSEPESYSSPGPVTIYFADDGTRLATPEVRQQPTVAAPDDVDTTFFPTGADQDTDNDGFPNFSGTSAAAPHAAGVAALLLQAAGGSGSLSDVQVRALLQATADPHDLDPNFAQAKVTTASGSQATLQGVGDSSNASAFDGNFFRLTLQDGANRRLVRAVIDLSAAGLKFDPTVASGSPFTVGTPAGYAGITGTVSGDNNTVLTVTFPDGGLAPGVMIGFGIDRDEISSNAGGNSADLLAGATVKIKVRDPSGGKEKATGTFANAVGAGYSPVDGFGLINAQAALTKLQTSGAP